MKEPSNEQPTDAGLNNICISFLLCSLLHFPQLYIRKGKQNFNQITALIPSLLSLSINLGNAKFVNVVMILIFRNVNTPHIFHFQWYFAKVDLDYSYCHKPEQVFV